MFKTFVHNVNVHNDKYIKNDFETLCFEVYVSPETKELLIWKHTNTFTHFFMSLNISLLFFNPKSDLCVWSKLYFTELWNWYFSGISGVVRLHYNLQGVVECNVQFRFTGILVCSSWFPFCSQCFLETTKICIAIAILTQLISVYSEQLQLSSISRHLRYFSKKDIEIMNYNT